MKKYTPTSLRRIDNNLCIQCGKELDRNGVRCKACCEDIRLRVQTLYSKRASLGLCVQCGKEPGITGETKRFCIDCWMKNECSRNTGNTSIWKEIKQKFYDQNQKCVYTGETLIPGVNASLDHIVPKCYGGTHDISNLQWITRKQNVKKNRTSDELHEIALSNGFETHRKMIPYSKNSKKRSDIFLLPHGKTDKEKNTFIREVWKKSGLRWGEFIYKMVTNCSQDKKETFDISDEKYKFVHEAWQDSTLPFSDFILLLIPLYWKNRNKVRPQEKWSVNVKPKRR